MSSLLVLCLLGSVSICFGCNYVVRSTSSDKAAVPLDVCYGTEFFAYTIYRCEEGVPYEYTYLNNYQCTGEYLTKKSAASQTYNCADTENCPYAKVTQYSDCNGDSGTEVTMIDVFVVNQCVEGTKATCDDTIAEVTRFNNAPGSCDGGHLGTNKEEYFHGCTTTARGNEIEYKVECGLISTSGCISYNVAILSVFVVLFSLFV